VSPDALKPARALGELHAPRVDGSEPVQLLIDLQRSRKESRPVPSRRSPHLVKDSLARHIFTMLESAATGIPNVRRFEVIPVELAGQVAIRVQPEAEPHTVRTFLLTLTEIQP
jgi:hypothetical protein